MAKVKVKVKRSNHASNDANISVTGKTHDTESNDANIKVKVTKK